MFKRDKNKKETKRDREFKYDIIKLIAMCIPFGLMLGSYFIFNNPLFIYLSFGIPLVNYSIIDIVLYYKAREMDMEGNNVIDLNEYKKRMGIVSNDRDMNKDIDRDISSISFQEKKALELIELQRKSVGCSKEEMLKILRYEIDIYYEVCELPMFGITDKKWDAFAGEIYDEFERLGLGSEYHGAMSELITLTFGEIISNDKVLVELNDFVRNMNCFDKYNLDDRIYNIGNNKIIDIRKYTRKR